MSNVFVSFMSSTTGRIVRIIAGVVLVIAGLVAIEGTGGLVVAAIGLIPLLAGVFDVCLFAPLFGQPLSGKAVRAVK